VTFPALLTATLQPGWIVPVMVVGYIALCAIVVREARRGR
jgi:hypothetical protein